MLQLISAFLGCAANLKYNSAQETCADAGNLAFWPAVIMTEDSKKLAGCFEAVMQALEKGADANGRRQVNFRRVQLGWLKNFVLRLFLGFFVLGSQEKWVAR